MNTSEYIASGVLEVYILGDLPPAEIAEVEDMAARHPEVRQELSRIEETCEVLAHQLPVTPRASLKNEILDKLAPISSENVQTKKQPDVARQPASKVSESPSAKPTKSKTDVAKKPVGNQRSLLPFQLGIAASLLVALISAAAALYFRSQWKETEQALDQALAQNQEIASQYETASQRAEQLENDLSIVSSPAFQQVALAGTDAFPESSANVYWNQEASQVYLDASNLPAPPNDKQYQLWAIVDGQPVSAGVFDLTSDDRSPLQAMSSSIANAAAFAITLEPRGGSESPTMEAMYVLGNVADS